MSIPDASTRCWAAKQVAANKGTDYIRQTFRKAKNVTGKTPALLISDGASNFVEGHKGEYAAHNCP